MIFRALVRVVIWATFPPAFRETYADEVRDSAVERVERSGRVGPQRLSYQIWILADLVRAGVGERLDRVPPIRSISSSFVTQAARGLLRTPTFSIAVVLLLGLSSVGTLAGLAITRGYLFTAPSLPGADRLVWVDYWTLPGGDGLDPWGAPESLSAVDWTVADAVGDASLMALDVSYAIVGEGQSAWIDGRRTTADFFDLLGLPPALGRYFDDTDDPSVAVISHDLWTTRFDSEASVIGATIRAHSIGALDEPRTFEIVGVLPAEAWFPTGLADITTPMAGSFRPRMIRLREGIEPSQAASRIAEAVAAESPTPFDPSWRPALSSVTDEYRDQAAAGVAATLIAVATLLGITLTNVSLLTMVRSEGRRSEFSTRQALGAPRTSLGAMLLTENGLLVGTSAVLSLVVTSVVMNPIAKRLHATIGAAPGGVSSITIGAGQLVAFIALVGAVAVLLAGVAARSANSSPSLGEDLRSRSTSARSKEVLTALQVGLSVTVLTVGGLLGRATLQLSGVDMGYSHDRVVSAEVALHSTRYRTEEQQNAFFDRVLAEAASMPEVESVSILRYSLAFDVPSEITVRATDGALTGLGAVVQPVGPAFFETLGIPLVSGRGFVPQDRAGPPVAVVGQRFAEGAWPSRSPIGQQIRLGLEDDQWHTVVGVSGNVREHLTRPDLANVYVARDRHPSPWGTIVARGDRSPHEVMPSIVEAIARVDADVPPWGLRALSDRVDAPAAPTRMLAVLLLGFAVTALVLTAVGIYGSVAYRVERQATELRIRMALGADAARVTRALIGRSSGVVAVGVLLGLTAAASFAALIESQLFNVERFDPVTYGLIGAGAMLVALAAAWTASRGVLKLPIRALE